MPVLVVSLCKPLPPAMDDDDDVALRIHTHTQRCVIVDSFGNETIRNGEETRNAGEVASSKKSLKQPPMKFLPMTF